MNSGLAKVLAQQCLIAKANPELPISLGNCLARSFSPISSAIFFELRCHAAHSAPRRILKLNASLTASADSDFVVVNERCGVKSRHAKKVAATNSRRGLQPAWPPQLETVRRNLDRDRKSLAGVAPGHRSPYFAERSASRESPITCDHKSQRRVPPSVSAQADSNGRVTGSIPRR